MAAIRVALFTPLPPSRTGTADYAAELIEELRSRVDLEVFDRVPLSFRPDRFDLLVYEIANNPFHAPFYEMALRNPGVVVLHETNLHLLIRGLTLQRADSKSYLREVCYEVFGQDVKPGAVDLSRIEVPQPQQFTMIRRLLDHSLACIVHSACAESHLRGKGYRKPIAVIPHGASLRNPDGMLRRRALGFEDGDFVVGCFGYLRPTKRVPEFLRAFHLLRGSVPAAKLLMAGQPHPEVPVEDELLKLGLHEHARVLGFQESLADFDQCLAGCDVIVNLRFPSFGESSGVTMRAFGMGKAVVMSDEGAARELPDEICLKVPVDRHEDAVVMRCLRWLFENPAVRSAIGEGARQWVAGTCLWDRVAESHAHFLRSVASEQRKESQKASVPHPLPGDAASIKTYLQEWVEPDSDRADYLGRHISRLARTLALIPPGGKEESILEMGCYLHLTPALRDILLYGEIRGCYLGPKGARDHKSVTNGKGGYFDCLIDLFNAETDLFPYPDGSFSVVLCSELLEHLQLDPMHMMTEIRRVLRPGGRIVLTTPNAASTRALVAVLRGDHPSLYSAYQQPDLAGLEPRHGREYTPGEILRLLIDSGFLVERIETGPYSHPTPAHPPEVTRLLAASRFPAELRDECIFAVAQKGPSSGSRYPSWLYQVE